MYEKIVFVDFDGTITENDTLDGAMRLLVPKEEYEEKYREMIEGKLTLSQALHMVFDFAPANRVKDMVAYVKSVPIRPGFLEFLSDMEELSIPVVIISGGLRDLIEAKIGIYRSRFLGMHYVDLDTSGQTMRLVSDYDDGVEVLKKTDIMAQYQYKSAICIGDSYTDIKMAEASDMVFARDILAKYLTKAGKPFVPWEDFYDVAEAIKSSR